MIDNELFTFVKSAIDQGLAARSVANVKVKRKFQRMQQGAESGAVVYLFKVGDKRVGSPRKADKWNAQTLKMDHTESQTFETTIQASVMVDEDPANVAQLTASDLANIVCDIMQGDDGLAVLRAGKVGVLRVGAVSNPYAVDDRSQYAASPSFDFVLTYRRARVSNVPELKTIDSRTGVYRV